MAVVVQCYHCNTILELDEGFRGGVCRCSTCGSLLQVPKAATQGAPKARPAAPGAAPTEIKRPANPNADPGISRGQFDRKNTAGASGIRPAVPDFGGSSSGLRQARPASPIATAEPRNKPATLPAQAAVHPNAHVTDVKKNNKLLYVGLALIAMILIVGIVLVIMTVSSPGIDSHPAPSQSPAGSPPAAVVVGPGDIAPTPQLTAGFLGVPLTGKKILLSIDGASSMSDDFDYVRVAAEHAAEKLGPDQEILVVVWKDDQLKPMPASGFVDKTGLQALRNQLDAFAVSGSSDPAACMKASLAQGADQIIFVTAKDQLDPQISAHLLAAAPGVRFDAIKIGDSDEPTLSDLAKKSNGTYQTIAPGRLSQISQ